MKVKAPIPFPSTGFKLLAGGMLTAGIAVSPTHGADAIWTGAADTAWATESNWTSTPVPGPGNLATFNNSGSGNTILHLDTGVTVGSIVFDTENAAAYTLGAGGPGIQGLTLNTLAGGISINDGVVNDQRIDANLSLSATGLYTGGLVNNSTSLLIVAGNLSGSAAGARALTIGGSGNTTISGNITDGTGTLGLAKTGAGTLFLAGTNAFSGTTGGGPGGLWIYGGRIDLLAGATRAGAAAMTGSTNSRVGNLTNSTAVLAISPEATLTWGGAGVKIGGEAGTVTGASGVLYNEGTLNQSATGTGAGNGIYLGGGGNSYGYIHNSGTTVVNGRLWIAQGENAAGAVGMLDVRSGSVTVNGTGNTAAQTLQINGDNNAHATSTSYAGINLVNGTLAIAKNAAQTNIGGGTNTRNLYTSINVTGTGRFTAGNAATDSGFGLGTSTSHASILATFTVANGGTLEAAYIYGANVLGTSVLTFDNGTLRSINGNAMGIIQGTNIKTHIQAGGVTFDTNGYTTIVANPLLAPTGNGVTGITLGGTPTGYVGAPVVEITGGGGIGAAAVADFDPSTGTITGITVTSHGSGYTSEPTVRLIGGNGGSTGAGVGTAAATAAIGPVTGGGLTKTGTGTLRLTAANTYSGDTRVEAGTLLLTQPTLADGAAVRLTTGTTLELTHEAIDQVQALFIDDVPQPDGIYNSGNSSFITGSGSLSVGAVPPSAYDVWLTGHGLTPGAANTAPGESADGSGVKNLLQFALGGNPADPADNGVQQIFHKDASNGDNLVLTLAVRNTASFSGSPSPAAILDGDTLVIQGSTDLASWSEPVEEIAVQTGGTLTAPSGYVLKSFRLVQAPALGSKGFLRVVAVRP